MNERNEALDMVYSAKTRDELEAGYAAWAASYDRETLEMGYALPFMITAWIARYVGRDSGPLLDAGCGTGLSGPYLKALGYDRIEGLDLSDDMLKLAESRGAYAELRKAALGETLPWADGHFAAFLASGVFTEGHAPATAFDELARITAKGGYGACTVREELLEGAGFSAKFAELEKNGVWRLVEESPPFRAFAIDEPEVFCRVFVFEML